MFLRIAREISYLLIVIYVVAILSAVGSTLAMLRLGVSNTLVLILVGGVIVAFFSAYAGITLFNWVESAGKQKRGENSG